MEEVRNVRARGRGGAARGGGARGRGATRASRLRRRASDYVFEYENDGRLSAAGGRRRGRAAHPRRVEYSE
ncbi:hypothetical protein EVAR_93181_1 [Eumeta japonica]|uniref:Uncharacterized protein n=1 Tax=Eumeta variegata TaxID=151549 RepID=A0A4C1TGJ3_EUMVA|nr:hypothetical protein EVAR_93181_1 [Eumeta japonica]